MQMEFGLGESELHILGIAMKLHTALDFFFLIFCSETAMELKRMCIQQNTAMNIL